MANQLVGKIRRELSVSKLVRTVDVPREQTQRLRIAQHNAVAETALVMNLASLLNVSVLVVSFWRTDLSRVVLAWGGLMLVVHAYIILTNVLFKSKKRKTDQTETLDGFTRGSTIVGILWALVPLIVFPFGDSIGVTAVAMLLMGMMFGAVLLIGRVPEAAMGLVIPIVLGILVGLQFQQDPRTNLLVIVVLASAGLLYFASRLAYTQFAQQHIDKTALEDQTEVIGLLLRDFEESTSDCLWQVDADGKFSALPDDIMRSAIASDLIVEGRQFVAIACDQTQRNEMASTIQAQRPFKDVAVKVGTDPDIWWSVTGKPLFSKGVFQGYRGVSADITQSKVSEDRIAFMAHFDSLTGLPNRNTFTDRLSKLSSSTEEWTMDYALVWLDLDNFKWVNDTLGHQSGDEVLRFVAKRLRKFAGDETLLARISGDEFAIICRSANYDDLKCQMDRLCAKLAEPYTIWGSSVLCRASIGVRIISGAGFDAEKVLKHADLALYKAKEHQKGSWALYDQMLEDKSRAMRELEVDLNNAVERNELRVFFQPIVDAKTHDVVGCETLLRWQHPTKGLLSPDTFIQFAEDSGVITQLGDWVIRQALSEARRLPDHVRIAINISPLQIHSESLIPTIVNALATNGIEPNRLELEITESVMISDTEFTMQRLASLKDLGLRIALDDFGTGFSSLSYLRKFPFDKLKIDKSFTEDLETSEDSRAITVATLQLAKAMGMRCTGEGVETPGQGEFLHKHGCEELQGYMISRPQPLESLGHLIKLKAKDAAPDGQTVVAMRAPSGRSVANTKKANAS